MWGVRVLAGLRAQGRVGGVEGVGLALRGFGAGGAPGGATAGAVVRRGFMVSVRLEGGEKVKVM